jgi:glycosyltransferase involved in cell wall biosynthesis
MDVSIIIPTKDRLTYLQRVLPSFLMQDEVKEIIVVVDGSTDGTLEFLEAYCTTNPTVRYLDNGVNRGIPYAKNRGIDAARCDYIFIGEDDLELTTDFLKTLSTHMAQDGADIICGRNIFRRDTETAVQSIERTDRLRGPYVNMRTIEVETSMRIIDDAEEPIVASPVLARTSVFRHVRFDERYEGNFWREETDFQLSARELGYKLFCCPHAICFNFEITDDRGGVHAVAGLRYERWTVTNNWRFILKHEQFVKENFDIGNKYVYIAKFAVRRFFRIYLYQKVLFHLSKTKRNVLAWSRRE